LILAGNARPLEDVVADEAEYLDVKDKRLEDVKALQGQGEEAGSAR
jgi:hypothetical protein